MRLKDSVYALEDPAIAGLYYAVPADRSSAPRLTALSLATLAPATPDRRAELCARASARLQGTPHELVRVDA